MWSTSTLKQRAKSILSSSYWMAFAVCIVSGIISGAGNIAYQFKGNSYGNMFNPGNEYDRYTNDPAFITMILGIVGITLAIGLTIGLAYTLFVIQPLAVGEAKFFLENRKGRTDFTNLFFAIKSGKYLNIVKSMAWQYLFTFLWTLLFIIPGIVKSYAYSMTPYILADNPDIGYDRALKLSMKMTDGYKGDIFVLQLSFIGWYLLGILCCYVGVLFVVPYYEATMAEMYGKLRKNAVTNGFCNPAELYLDDTDFWADNQ